jgi:methylenetetrahydrofolate dehydrogenase (NADP+)/methenyltetrahydrofolate cyclohydrolase
MATGRVAQILDGKKVANDILAALAGVPRKRTPGLATIIVGNRQDSAKYVAAKHAACRKVGIDTSKSVVLPNTSQLERTIDELNNDDSVDGILLQLPLPDSKEQEKYIARIAHEKDVDGFHPYNVGMLCRAGEAKRQGLDMYYCPPCTPLGVMTLLRQYNIDLEGKRAVVLGRSNVVGLPMTLMLTHANATVTCVHSKSNNIIETCKEADVLVAAIGKANVVKADWVKPGAVVVDVGMNVLNGKTTGDVDYEQVRQVASYITPVPGGVGPMTVAMLISNTIKNAERRGKLS